MLALSCTSVQAQESGAAESSSSSSPDASATASDRPRLSYSQLADTLEDPAARDKLVEQLRTLAEADASQAEEAPVQPSGVAVWSQRLGATLEAATAQLGNDLRSTLDALGHLGTSDGLTQGKLEGWVPALRLLALVIAATLLAYALLRALAGVAFGKLNAWIRKRPVPAVDGRVVEPVDPPRDAALP